MAFLRISRTPTQMSWILTFIVLLFSTPNRAERLTGSRKWGLRAHNLVRAKHGVPQMTLSHELSNVADRCAQYYADKGKIDHSCYYGSKNFGSMGENLFSIGPVGNPEPEGTLSGSATYSWYSELDICFKKGFDFAVNKTEQLWGCGAGHFSQVVWRGSDVLGIGQAWNSTTKITVVCGKYYPPGNVMGIWKYNVFPPLAEEDPEVVAARRSESNCLHPVLSTQFLLTIILLFSATR